jgi:hypothetical protein
MEKETRLKKFFSDEETYNNIIHLYKQLHRKESLELRLFLKGFVYGGIQRCYYMDRGLFYDYNVMFSPKKDPWRSPFTLDKLEGIYKNYKGLNSRLTLYGFNVREELLTKLI